MSRRYHEAGNVGVEHAAPDAVRCAPTHCMPDCCFNRQASFKRCRNSMYCLVCCRAALAAARASTPERAEFRRDDLDAWGLAGPVQLEKATKVRPCARKCAQGGSCFMPSCMRSRFWGALFTAANVVQQMESSERALACSRLLCMSDAYSRRHCRLRGLQVGELGPELCGGGCWAHSWASGSATASSCCAC